MRYTLVIGNRNYSSWSMRAWLLLRFLDLDFAEIGIALYRAEARAEVQALGGETGLVPVLIDGETAIWDTLAITETLFETHRQVWPADPHLRARARSYCGEVHSGFNALREAMPVNTRARNRRARITPAVEADIARACAIWSGAGRYAGEPWLFGPFCAADIMFAPVAARFRTYGVDVPAAAQPYYQALLAHPLVAEWCALGADEEAVIPIFELPESAES